MRGNNRNGDASLALADPAQSKPGEGVQIRVGVAVGEREAVDDMPLRVAVAVPVALDVAVIVAVPFWVPLGDGIAGVGGRHGSAARPDTTAAGTVACPSSFLPQQVTAPPVDRAHAWPFPAATVTWPPAAAAVGTAAV
jgi:hypothetical protein